VEAEYKKSFHAEKRFEAIITATLGNFEETAEESWVQTRQLFN